MRDLALVALGTGAPWPARAVWRLVRGKTDRDVADKLALAKSTESEIERLTRRCSDLEELVDLLRRALDKHLMRESAIVSACELLIALAKLVPEPNSAMLHIRDRAEQLLQDAKARTSSINQLPRP